MEPHSPHLVVIAGEASGDLHAAGLVRELKALRSSLTFSGLGGQRMAAEGVELYADMTEMAVIGFVEVLRHYGAFKRLFARVLEEVRARRAAAVILVDFPGFNLRLAKALRQRGVPVIYYISPQVWAWKSGRVETVRRSTDRMLVLFEFEREFYKNFGVDVAFVGHPLMDRLPEPVEAPEARRQLGLDGQRPAVGLLPGSRENEIAALLPVMLNAAALLAKENPSLQFVLAKAPTVPAALLSRYLTDAAVKVTVAERDRYTAIQACDACMVASGTATLETAILSRPMAVIYKTAFLTWLLAKGVIRIPYIGLVNVVAGQQVVPECVQFDATAPVIAGHIRRMLTDAAYAQAIRKDLQNVRRSLGEPGASRRAAEEIIKFL